MIDPRDIPHAIELVDTVMSVNAPIRADFTQPEEPQDAPEQPEAMSDEKLKGIIAHKLQSSNHWYGNNKLSANRVDADKYYNGDPRGDEIEGRSQVISRDVAETVDALMPDLLEIFASGDEIVKFEPNNQKDEPLAQQATDYINYLFFQKNDGFNILHTWFKDALLKKNGIVEAWFEERINRTKEIYTGLTQQQYEILKNDPNLTVISEQQNDTQVQSLDPVTGAPVVQVVPYFDCTVILTKPEKRILVGNVAPDEFFIESCAVGEEQSGFLGKKTQRTISELIELGYDKDKVHAIPRSNDETSQERAQRFNDENLLLEDDSLDESMRKVWVTEPYIKVDYDGDGISEWRHVTLGNETILDNEEVDGHGFASLTPIPMPHKFYGKSLYDQVHDIQDVKTALWRGGLDSLYLANSPQRYVVEGQANMDDVLDRRVGGIVRVKNPTAVGNLATEMVAPQAFQMIEYADTVRENRTGVVRNNQGLNPDTLNKTAHGIQIITNAGQKRVKLIARIFAETGVKRLFQRMFDLSCLHMDQPQMIKLRGKWVTVDPREWKNKMSLTISVGLGTGNKEQQIQTAMALLTLDEQIVTLQKGINGPLLTGKNIYNKLSKLVEAAGWKSVDPYYTDPDTFKAPPPPPSPPPTPDQLKDLASLEMKRIDVQIKNIELEIEKLKAGPIIAGLAAQQLPNVMPQSQPAPENLGPPVHPRPIMGMPQQ